MAEAIQKKFGVKVKLIKSSGGVFEVMAGKNLIFSKKKEDRFPEHHEVLGN